MDGGGGSVAAGSVAAGGRAAVDSAVADSAASSATVDAVAVPLTAREPKIFPHSRESQPAAPYVAADPTN